MSSRSKNSVSHMGNQKEKKNVLATPKPKGKTDCASQSGGQNKNSEKPR